MAPAALVFPVFRASSRSAIRGERKGEGSCTSVQNLNRAAGSGDAERMWAISSAIHGKARVAGEMCRLIAEIGYLLLWGQGHPVAQPGNNLMAEFQVRHCWPHVLGREVTGG
jgi:hypothetical protein